ncbi:hypothetical protein XaC1_34 [Xanthomonas phage XaC1]|nr:hypothetical protein XaC1_34 [Xanthomonas phage XaC1]
MKVYRIELKYSLLDEQSKKFYNSTNQGPMCNILGSWIYLLNGYSRLNLCTSIDYMPEPESDGISDCGGWHFGFKDLEQFEMFFNGDINNLEWSGYTIAVYEVPEKSVQLGGKQLCFIMQHSVLIEYLPLRKTMTDNRREKYGYPKKTIATV